MYIYSFKFTWNCVYYTIRDKLFLLTVWYVLKYYNYASGRVGIIIIIYYYRLGFFVIRYDYNHEYELLRLSDKIFIIILFQKNLNAESSQ